MADIGLLIAFTGGVVSFFAPCVVPLIPAYVSYVTGVSLADLKKHGEGRYRKTIILSSLFYVLGFSLIFVILGTAAASFGSVLRLNSVAIQRVGGVLVILFGLNFAGILKFKFLARQTNITLPAWADRLGHGRSFLLGLIFGVSWTPCVGAVLGTILILAANSATIFSGALLLFVYSLGISIPFLIISMFLAQVPKYLKLVTKYIGPISVVSGLLLTVLGVLLLTDTYKYLNAWLFEVAFRFGYEIK